MEPKDKSSSHHPDLEERKRKLIRWPFSNSGSNKSTDQMKKAEEGLSPTAPTASPGDAGHVTGDGTVRNLPCYLWKVLPLAGKTSAPEPNESSVGGDRTPRTSTDCEEARNLMPIEGDLEKGPRSMKHLKSDWWLPGYNTLKSFMIPERKLLCNLCLSLVPTSGLCVLEECKCRFCRTCLRRYLETNIREGKVPVTCPNEKCSSSIRNQEIGEIAGKDALEMFERNKLYLDVERDPTRVWCPTDDCETVCSLQPGDDPDAPCRVNCDGCQLQFCSVCKQKWHGSVACDEAREVVLNEAALPTGVKVEERISQLEEKRDQLEDEIDEKEDQIDSIEEEIEQLEDQRERKEDESSDRKKDEGSGSKEKENDRRGKVVMKCPKCHASLDKTNHWGPVMCYKCSHVFCWHCQADLNKDILLIHYYGSKCEAKLGCCGICYLIMRVLLSPIIFAIICALFLILVAVALAVVVLVLAVGLPILLIMFVFRILWCIFCCE